MPRFPLIPTLVVLAAVATMIVLGFWQLGRLEEKEALIARYAKAHASPEVVSDDAWKDRPEDYGYRQVASGCRTVGETQLVAGKNAQGQSGWAHVVPCMFFESFHATSMHAIVLGWSREPAAVEWEGGDFTAILVPAKKSNIDLGAEFDGPTDKRWHSEFYLVADPPLAGLEANARPDPTNLPNNHLAYAVQWFIFAVTALVIYVLALKRKQRGG